MTEVTANKGSMQWEGNVAKSEQLEDMKAMKGQE